MTHPRSGPPDGANTAGAGAEKAAFLRDLRALRDQAGLGPRDLAARAHFPEDTLTTAEAGPDLPSLPVLQAYVRGCGAAEAEWEDRWRRLNAADGTDGTSPLPTRAPSSARQPARVMPFPVSGSGPNESDQDTIGFGLARVARGLVPLSPDSGQTPPDLPTRTPFGAASTGNGGMRPSTEFSEFSDFSEPGNGAAGTGGWFDPAPKDGIPPAPEYTPPPAVPPPPASPGAPTVQYPAAGGYQPADYQAPEYTYQSPSTYSPPPTAPSSAPSGRLPEEFRTPAPLPPDLAGPAGGSPAGGPARGTEASGFGSRFAASDPGSGTTSPGAGSPAPISSNPAPSNSGATAATPTPHAAPAVPRRRTSGWVVAAVIIILIIAAAIWLVLSH